MGGVWVLALAVSPGLGCATASSWFAGPTPEERREAEERRLAEAEAAAVAERAENPLTIDEKLERGDQALATGNLAGALWDYASAYRRAPDDPRPQVRLGFIHLRHDPERARPFFESAIALDAELASARVGLGLAMLSAGELEAGIAELERAVALDAESVDAQAALGVALDQRGDHEAAIVHLEKARQLDPRDGRVLNNLGVAYLRVGKPVKSERVLREALRLDRADEVLRSNNLGMALGMQGRFEDALEAFRVSGNEQGAQNNLAYLYQLQGNYDAAVTHYEAALMAGGDADLQVLKNLEAARAMRVARGDASPVSETPLAGAVTLPVVGSALENLPEPRDAR